MSEMNSPEMPKFQVPIEGKPTTGSEIIDPTVKIIEKLSIIDSQSHYLTPKDPKSIDWLKNQQEQLRVSADKVTNPDSEEKKDAYETAAQMELIANVLRRDISITGVKKKVFSGGFYDGNMQAFEIMFEGFRESLREKNVKYGTQEPFK